jgi:hypothetical protein
LFNAAMAMAVSITCISVSAPQGPEMINGRSAVGNQWDNGVIFKSIDIESGHKKAKLVNNVYSDF